MTNVVPRGDTVLRSVLHLADLAPNAGGYQWRLTDGAAHLHVDAPDSRPAVLLGVGAVLHHLRIALAAAGWGALISRGTTPSDPTHIASIRAVRKQPTTEQVAMAAAISVRTGDDADYGEAAVPWTVLNRLAAQARAEGAEMTVVLDHETRIRMLRRTRSLRNAGVVAVIGSRPGDEVVAGAALSAVLLMGTVWGLLGCQLPVRPLLAQQVIGPDLVPQVVLRLGYPRT
ncbi:hypothetical protein GCM10018954_079340 [Kutzneria kofuensis]